MAAKSLKVIAQVQDAASATLRKIQGEMRKTTGSVNNMGAGFIKFNRTLFTTTAFANIFIRTFSRLGDLLSEGADFDLLSNQFERTLGPKGDFLKQIHNLTTSGIDNFAAMSEAVSLSRLGIMTDTNQIASMMAKAATAAKLAGLKSGEGIKAYSEFLKDGSIAHLQELNLLNKSNVAFQAQMHLLEKAAGPMGSVVSLEARLALGQKLLESATKGALQGNRDFSDVMQDLTSNFKFFRGEIGRFVGSAVAPLLDKIQKLLFEGALWIENIFKTDKNLKFLTKSIISVATAAGSLVAVFGTLRLSLIALSSVGIGVPALEAGLLGLLGSFLLLTSGTSGFIERLKVLGAIFKGAFELVHSFLADPENFAKGIGLMDKETANFLRSKGLLNLVTNIARFSATTILFVEDAGKQLVEWFKELGTWINKALGGIRSILGVKSGPWSRSWIEGIGGIRGALVKLTAAFVGFLALKKAFGPILARLPVVGGLFGGGGFGGPKGSKFDPLYTISMGQAAGSVLGKLSTALGSLFSATGLTGVLSRFFAPATKALGSFGKALMLLFAPFSQVKSLFQMFATTLSRSGFIKAFQEIPALFRLFGESFGGVTGLLGRVGSVFSEALAVVGKVIAPLLVIGSAIYGAAQGIAETAGEWAKFGKGIFDLAKAVFNVVDTFIENNKYLKMAKDAISTTVEGIYKIGKFVIVDIPLKLLKLIAEGWKNIFKLLGMGAGKLGEAMSDLAEKISPTKAPEVPAAQAKEKGLPGEAQNPAIVFPTPRKIQDILREGLSPVEPKTPKVITNSKQLDESLGIKRPAEPEIAKAQQFDKLAITPINVKALKSFITFADKLDAEATKQNIAPGTPVMAPEKERAMVPTMPTSQEDIMDSLTFTAEQLKGAQQEAFTQAMQDALDNNARTGQQQITPEEWVGIFMSALDRSDNLSQLVDNSKKTSTTMNVKSRRE